MIWERLDPNCAFSAGIGRFNFESVTKPKLYLFPESGPVILSSPPPPIFPFIGLGGYEISSQCEYHIVFVHFLNENEEEVYEERAFLDSNISVTTFPVKTWLTEEQIEDFKQLSRLNNFDFDSILSAQKRGDSLLLLECEKIDSIYQSQVNTNLYYFKSNANRLIFSIGEKIMNIELKNHTDEVILIDSLVFKEGNYLIDYNEQRHYIEINKPYNYFTTIINGQNITQFTTPNTWGIKLLKPNDPKNIETIKNDNTD